MSLPTTPISTPPPTPARVQTTDAPRLREPWLLLARLACAVGVLLALGPFTAGLLVRLAHLDRLSAFEVRSDSGWTPGTFAAALARLGLSVGLYQLCSLMLDLFVVLSFVLIAALLLWRKSDEGLALLVALALITLGAVWFTNFDRLVALAPGWSWLFTLVNLLSFALGLVFCLVFPDGRFVPGWTRWWWVVLVAAEAAGNFFPPLLGVAVAAFFGVLASGLLAQVYRYRRHANPVQRQQIKWLVFGFGATLPGFLLFLLLGALVPALGPPGTAGLLYELAFHVEGDLLFLPIPLCVGVALFRYRLFDIDVIIRRTLVYGTLSAILAALYFGIVVGLQTLVGAVNSTAASSQVIIVASTLLIAALFNPLRHGIQATIDQRFYRHKVDAERTLANFGATLRSEVELAEVSAHLLTVVNETMQPAHASLWLRAPPPQRGTPDTQPLTGGPLGSRGPSGNVRA